MVQYAGFFQNQFILRQNFWFFKFRYNWPIQMIKILMVQFTTIKNRARKLFSHRIGAFLYGIEVRRWELPNQT